MRAIREIRFLSDVVKEVKNVKNHVFFDDKRHKKQIWESNKGKERQEWERDTTAARGQSPAPPLLSFTPLENGCAEGAAGHFVITVAINNNSSSASGHGLS